MIPATQTACLRQRGVQQPILPQPVQNCANWMKPTVIERERILRNTPCPICGLRMLTAVRDEEGDSYIKCLACGKHSLLPDPERIKGRDANAVIALAFGCQAADEKLGGKSNCLECPFEKECVYNTLDNTRREKIRSANLAKEKAHA